MKWLAFLRGKKRPWHAGLSFKVRGSQGALLLEHLCRGERIGGREACLITKSHNGLRRLNELKRTLRLAGIAYWSETLTSPAGRPYKVIQIFRGDRLRARQLIRGA